MSGLPSRLETVTKKQFITIPQAVAALANMERELDSAESYAQIRKLADAAEALKILFRHVAEVKNKAELVVLAANARIGDEIKLIPKANKHQSPMAGTGIPHTSRLRLQKILVPARRPNTDCRNNPANACRPFLPVRVFYLSKLGFFLHQNRAFIVRLQS